MKYHFESHKEGTHYWAECLELEGCLTQGTSMMELKANASEALNLYLDEPEDSKAIFALPFSDRSRKKNVFEIEVDPRIAFSMLLRQTRMTLGITQKAAAKKLGIENLYSYQRLEHRANPTLKTMHRVKSAFPEFPLELVL